MPDRPISSWLILLAPCLFSCLAAAPCRAQQSPGVLEKELTQALRPACEQFSRKLLTSREIGAVLDTRPISVESICDCSEAKILLDVHIAASLQAPRAEVDVLAKTVPFKSYVIARQFASTFECLATELDSSLKIAKPRP